MATERSAPAKELVQAKSSEKKRRKPNEAKVDPRLAVYFGKAVVSPSAFVRAVAEAGQTSFTDTDVSEAERLREAGDPGNVRLLGLATQPKLPKPVTRWLWPAVLKVIRARVPSAAEPANIDVDAAFRRLHHELGEDLASEETQTRQSATVILQLGLAWMVLQRNLNLAGALQVLGDTYARGEASITKDAVRSLSSGKVTDIERSVAISKGDRGLSIVTFGIDFGTTNSLAARIVRDRPLALVDIGSGRPHPSVVWYTGDSV